MFFGVMTMGWYYLKEYGTIMGDSTKAGDMAQKVA